MKRIIFPWGVIFLIIFMALVSYAEMKKIAISEANLSDLKGKWVGSRTVTPVDTRNTDLEISNDSLPLQCKFTLYGITRYGRGSKTLDRDLKGKINDQGNLFVKTDNIEVELSLYEDGGKKKLEGNYYWMGVKGTMSFKKK
jgi:hypothetical protein